MSTHVCRQASYSHKHPLEITQSCSCLYSPTHVYTHVCRQKSSFTQTPARGHPVLLILVLPHSCLHIRERRAPTCSHGVDECQECVGGLDVEDAAHWRHTLTQSPQDGDGGEGKRSRGVELGTQVVHWPRVQRPGDGEGNKGYVGKVMCTCVHGNRGYQESTIAGGGLSVVATMQTDSNRPNKLNKPLGAPHTCKGRTHKERPTRVEVNTRTRTLW
jgi:hypothetical protein